MKIDLSNPNEAYWVIVSEKDGHLKLHQCSTPASVALVLKGLPDDVEGLVIAGERIHITQGPFRFLRVPELEPIPLFDTPTMGPIDKSLSLGKSSGPPPAVSDDYNTLMAAELAAEVQSAGLEEEEPDEEEEADE